MVPVEVLLGAGLVIAVPLVLVELGAGDAVPGFGLLLLPVLLFAPVLPDVAPFDFEPVLELEPPPAVDEPLPVVLPPPPTVPVLPPPVWSVPPPKPPLVLGALLHPVSAKASANVSSAIAAGTPPGVDIRIIIRLRLRKLR
jgi:hypothetical protein